MKDLFKEYQLLRDLKHDIQRELEEMKQDRPRGYPDFIWFARKYGIEYEVRIALLERIEQIDDEMKKFKICKD